MLVSSGISVISVLQIEQRLPARPKSRLIVRVGIAFREVVLLLGNGNKRMITEVKYKKTPNIEFEPFALASPGKAVCTKQRLLNIPLQRLLNKSRQDLLNLSQHRLYKSCKSSCLRCRRNLYGRIVGYQTGCFVPRHWKIKRHGGCERLGAGNLMGLIFERVC